MAYYTEKRQLDLGARLMSTRPRPSNIKTDNFTSMRVPLKVPFSWERAPGIPKDNNNNNEVIQLDDDHVIMPPKPPPGWRRSPDNYNTGDSDVGNHYYCSDSDVFSDALDEISLSESFGVACRMSVDGQLDHRLPSFIMNRFLPAANALAVDSAPANVPKYSKPRADHQLLQRETSSTRHRRPKYPTVPPPIRTSKPSNEADLHHHQQQQHSRLPSRVCGLMPVLPWSLKSAICGFKNPVTTPRASVDEPPLTVRTKRHGYDDRVTSRKGMPFLDTSRLMRVTNTRSRDGGKLRDLIRGSRDTELVSKNSRVHTDQKRRPSWSLPQIHSPSEPWLSHAVNSGKRR